MADAPKKKKPFEELIEKFITRMRRAELPDNVFNIYHTTDAELDARGGAAKRRENLRRYLKAVKEPKYVLIGLAPGYRGARFTGVPFSDEHRLCYPGSCYDRTSSRERPWREASAGAVMEALGARFDVLCFNVVPWHPHVAGNPLSNADPDAETIALGVEVLDYFFTKLYPNAQPVSVGRVAQKALAEGWTDAPHLRHPAHGGAAEFRAGLFELLGQDEEE